MNLTLHGIPVISKSCLRGLRVSPSSQEAHGQ